MSPERPYQKIFVELSFPNTEQLVNDKFDQIRVCINRRAPARESANNMNVEPTAQLITFKDTQISTVK